ATGQKIIQARKTIIRTEDVSFRNGDVVLSGTLLLPPRQGSYPAVVLTHTSSPAVRTAYREAADFFIAQGFAVLIYDKRGTGASTGKRLASIADLAGDALAGLRIIQGRADINPRRIGLWGASQGGWICQVAAAGSRDVAFIILVSAPSMSPVEQEMFRTEQLLRAAGNSESEVKAALTYQRQFFE